MAQAHCGSPSLSAPAVSRLVARHPASGYLDLLARLAMDEVTDAAAMMTWSRNPSISGDQGTSGDGSQHARGVNPEWLAAFALAAASVIDAKGMRHQVTMHDIVRLLEVAHEAEPHHDMAPEHRDLWLDAHHLSGSTRPYPFVRSNAVESRSWRVSVDELNPYRDHPGPIDPAVDGAESVWLAELSRAFTEGGLSALSLPDGPTDPLHRVEAQTRPSSIVGPLVSVVIPVFEPDEGPAFSLASITRQSWTNLEVLICDDGSGSHGRDTLLRWADLDPRARVLRSERNAGAYAAMNMGLAHARGEFVTFQGSDDWSHPQRIERQVKALQKRPQVMGTLSHMVQVDDRMSLT
ncbi:MAG: glycosyltransferase family 2 protein, partial [Ornithinimicrobium sp.]